MKKTDTELKNMEERYKLFPKEYMPRTRKKKTRTNELTHLILEHCKSIGATAYRLTSTGQWDARLKKWRPSMQKKGLGDIMIIYKGHFISCEVKTGKDKLRPDQIARRDEIKKAKGSFIEARTIEQFITDLTTITNTIK